MEYRSAAKVLGLSIITLGIYAVYWLYRTRKEMVDDGAEIPPISIFAVPAVLGFSGMVITFFMLLNDSSSEVTSSGFDVDVSNSNPNGFVVFVFILTFILMFVAMLTSIFWFYKYCKAVEIGSKDKINMTFSFGLFLITSFVGLPIIWPAIMQDAFNTKLE